MIKGLDARDQNQRGSTLGDIVREFYRFIDAGANTDHLVLSPTESYQPIKASAFFAMYGKNNRAFAVRQERLPFDRDIRAILYHRGKINVETAKVDFEELKRELSGHQARVHGKSVFSGDIKIISSRTQNVGTFDKLDVRTLLTLIPDYQTMDAAVSVEAVDRLYDQGCFDYGSGGVAISAKPVLKQKMEMRQELQQLQVPKMLPLMQQTWRIARLAHFGRVLKMNNTQLSKHLREEAARNPALEVRE